MKHSASPSFVACEWLFLLSALTLGASAGLVSMADAPRLFSSGVRTRLGRWYQADALERTRWWKLGEPGEPLFLCTRALSVGEQLSRMHWLR